MCKRLESLGCVSLPVDVWCAVADDYDQHRDVLWHCSSQLLDQQLQPYPSEGAWVHFRGSSGASVWMFEDAALIRPDPLDPFVCCRQCFLSWILLPVDIY
jgi:hypothetical protein